MILAIRIFPTETKSTYCAVSIDLMGGGLLFNYPVEIVTYVVQNEIKNEKGTYVCFNFGCKRRWLVFCNFLSQSPLSSSPSPIIIVSKSLYNFVFF